METKSPSHQTISGVPNIHTTILVDNMLYHMVKMVWTWFFQHKVTVFSFPSQFTGNQS